MAQVENIIRFVIAAMFGYLTCQSIESMLERHVTSKYDKVSDQKKLEMIEFCILENQKLREKVKDLESQNQLLMKKESSKKNE